MQFQELQALKHINLFNQIVLRLENKMQMISGQVPEIKIDSLDNWCRTDTLNEWLFLVKTCIKTQSIIILLEKVFWNK